jgi:glycosyltransferase involved in cell wall biosynthesis
MADSYVTASVYEAFSLAMLEAAAVGIPLVSPLDINGVSYLLDANSGIGVKRDGASIAGALTDLNDEKLRRRLGAGARRRALEFTLDKQARQYMDVLRTARDMTHG